jgi:hypothetical protein
MDATNATNANNATNATNATTAPVSPPPAHQTPLWSPKWTTQSVGEMPPNYKHPSTLRARGT